MTHLLLRLFDLAVWVVDPILISSKDQCLFLVTPTGLIDVGFISPPSMFEVNGKPLFFNFFFIVPF